MIKTNIDKRMKYVSIIGFIFTVISGALLHFLFEASGGNTLVGAFTPVNESIWEHLKLLLFPAVFFGIFEYFCYGKYKQNFFPSKIYGILIGTASIVVLYYTYSGIIGTRFAAVDISLFVIGTAIAYYLPYIFMKKVTVFVSEKDSIISIVILAVVILMFIYFTFHTPMLALFKDPISDDYGIQTILFLNAVC